MMQETSRHGTELVSRVADMRRIPLAELVRRAGPKPCSDLPSAAFNSSI